LGWVGLGQRRWVTSPNPSLLMMFTNWIFHTSALKKWHRRDLRWDPSSDWTFLLFAYYWLNNNGTLERLLFRFYCWVGLGVNLSGLGWAGFKKIDPQQLCCSIQLIGIPFHAMVYATFIVLYINTRPAAWNDFLSDSDQRRHCILDHSRRLWEALYNLR